MDYTILDEWLQFAVRWFHVIAGIAWIGSSFYFIALDLGLRRDKPLATGADGEEWQVHGGGFYHIQKYMVAPEALPEHLTWFKWEAYTTWLTGFLMMILVYYMGANIYLVDPNVLAMPVWVAICISIGSLALGWVLYDLICKSRFGDDNTRLMIGLYIILVAMAWGYTHVFSGRAALLHLGAFTATIMSANVFMIIIPNQKIVVADLRAGRTPDPKYGKIAKQRSTHNNYLTLPVLFLMLSNHYPLAFATKYNWIIASLVFLMGVTIRHFFNTYHRTKQKLWWTWVLTALIFAVIIWLSMAPVRSEEVESQAQLSPAAMQFAQAPGFQDVTDIVTGNCSMCHAKAAGQNGIVPRAPKDVLLETPAEIAEEAHRIYIQAGVTHAMPPGSYNYMDPADRAKIVAWFRAGEAGIKAKKQGG